MSDTNNDINPIESVQKIPKKRGRKPKGGKIVQSSLSSDNNNSTPNVILQLKCGADDLKNLGNFSSKEFNYAPQQIDEKINPYQFNEENNCFGIVNQPEIKKETVIVDENILEDNESDKESIYQKLKMLAHDLHTNNLSDKRSACFWCTHDFDNPPIYVPKHVINGTYHVYGCFCSPECAAGHLFKQSDIDASSKFERYTLLNHIYCKIYNYVCIFKCNL